MTHDFLQQPTTPETRTSTQPHASLFIRKVIHFDMDCFYAAIEMRDDPTLRNRPVIVGGSPDARGVVCTANYLAREFGVHSAMPAAWAKKLCPKGVFLRPDFQRYKAVSNQIREIFKRYTPTIEPLSLDEAYLDVTHNTQGLYAVKIARLIQEEIHSELHLTGSAGVAPNKLVAKIASDFRKPMGITVVLPERVPCFMGQLNLRKISGIGPASETRLNKLGYKVCQDIWPVSPARLCAELGERMGHWLYERARGIDTRPVQARAQRKSIGKEDTFPTDITDPGVLDQHLKELAAAIWQQLQRLGLSAKTVTLKVKYSDFKQITRAKTLSEPIDSQRTVIECARVLLGKTQTENKAVRLLGISLSKLDSQKRTPAECLPLTEPLNRLNTIG